MTCLLADTSVRLSVCRGQFKAILDENSLKCRGSHTPLAELMGSKFDNTVEENAMLRNRNLVIPGLPQGYMSSAAGWKAAAALLYLETRSDVILQLDTGNSRVAGADPASH